MSIFRVTVLVPSQDGGSSWLPRVIDVPARGTAWIGPFMTEATKAVAVLLDEVASHELGETFRRICLLAHLAGVPRFIVRMPANAEALAADIAHFKRRHGLEQLTVVHGGVGADIAALPELHGHGFTDPATREGPGEPEITDQVSADLVWTSDQPLVPGRVYGIDIAGQMETANITALRHKLNIENGDHLAAKSLNGGDIGFANLGFSRALKIAPYEKDRKFGSFVLRDHDEGSVCGIGLIRFGLRRASNVHWQSLDVNRQGRERLKQQRACCLWFTGLSGSGKSTIANLLDQRLHAMGYHTYTLDGDNVRHGLNRDLGFTEADRVENIRRVAEVSKLMVDAGLIVLVSFISPFRAERRMARALFETQDFIEIFVDTPLAVCQQRDPKGLYAKAMRGELKNFTGLDSPYERPERPDIHLETAKLPAGEGVEVILSRLEAQNRPR